MVMQQQAAEVVRMATDRVIPRWHDIARYWRTVVRSGVIGTSMGIIPGVGEDIGAWASYAAARRASRERAQFGKGSVEGLMAAETGNNAAVPGAIIPVLTLAVPGSAPAAVLLAAMFIHGVRPGPLIMLEFPTFISEVVAMLLLASAGILIYGLLLTRPLLYVLAVPRERLMPLIFVLCTIGSFAIASRLFDVYVMLGFGLLGFVLRAMSYPMAPLVLGLVLGDILDKSLRRGLVLSDGGLGPFFTRPISLVLWLTIVITVLLSFETVRQALGRLLMRRPAAETEP
jgi:putative tricarboxylic transport membrane protein